MTSRARRALPELPEVETVRRDLAEVIPGRTVTKVTVSGARSVRRQDRVEFERLVTGRRFGQVSRHGKFLVLSLDDGPEALVVHLRMSGQVRLHRSSDEVAKHTHVVFDLGGFGQMRFVDPRTFGELFVDTLDDDGRPSQLVHLGPDALDDRLTAAVLHRRVTAGRRSLGLKAALLDQRVLAGVGNLYADEALFAARLRPSRPAAAFSRDDAGLVRRELRRILRAAIAARGSSFADAAYVDTRGVTGGYATRHQVYGRAGQPCPACGTTILRIVVAARGTHLCPSCQT